MFLLKRQIWNVNFGYWRKKLLQMVIIHDITAVHFDNENIYLEVDGIKVKAPMQIVSQKLFKASEVQRMIFNISPSGYGIHWPLIDEDLAVDPLLKFAVQP
jgi:hypothetical protein